VTGPQTLVGKWVRLIPPAHEEARKHLLAEMRRTKGWTRGRVEVLNNAFQIALRMRFPTDGDVRDITRFVHDIDPILGHRGVGPLEVEAKIREALGEDVSTEGIDVNATIAISRLVLGLVVDDLGLTQDDIDNVVAEAERRAVREGHYPIPTAEEELTGVKLAAS
jgi:hypothetical protein